MTANQRWAGWDRSRDLAIHEQVLLLVLDDRKGTCRTPHAERVLAGAVLVDLLRAEAISIDGDDVRPVPRVPGPLGAVRDAAAVIAAESRSRALRWWVDRLPGQMKPFLPRLAARLVHKGVLIQEEHKLFGVFARTRLPERDHSLEAQTCERLRAVLLGERTPDADDAALTALVDAAGLVKSIVDRPQRAEAQRRAKEIGREDLVATAVRAAIKAANEAIAASTAATTAATI